MGAAGLARVREMFTWEGVADALAGVYARVAKVDMSAEAATQASIATRLAAGGASA
jgi:hypothetical protein